MTTGTIMLYTGIAMVGVSVVAGIPVLLILRHVHRKIRHQIYTDFR